ncbi:MAG: DUF2190 family protein [Candidatus Peribacteraceae bacterium]|nr:DUF2190 family protein [Candidatus Peribacteraceae bacterium]
MSQEHVLMSITKEAAADLSAKKYYCIAQDANGKAALASSATAKGNLGILQNKPASGEAANIAVLGTSKAILGGTVDEGDQLTTDANGKLIATTSAGDFVVAEALEAGVLNDIAEVRLVKYRY